MAVSRWPIYRKRVGMEPHPGGHIAAGGHSDEPYIPCPTIRAGLSRSASADIPAKGAGGCHPFPYGIAPVMDMRFFYIFAGFSPKGLEYRLGVYASYCVTCFCSEDNGTETDCMVREVTIFHLPFTQPSYCWGLCVTKGNCPTSESLT